MEDGAPFGYGQVSTLGCVVETHHETRGGLDGWEVVFGLEEGFAEGCGVCHFLECSVYVMVLSAFCPMSAYSARRKAVTNQISNVMVSY